MFTLPDLPYAYNALEPYIDEATMKVHHDGHHAAYVKNLNDLLSNLPEWENKTLPEILTSLDKLPGDIRTKVHNNAGGVANHNFFWEIMSPEKQAVPEKFKNIIEPFNSAALSLFGSGWVWLTKDLEIISTTNQDSLLTIGKVPILGIDLWEHAYYLKYQNKRKDYIAAWWNVVNWSRVEKNLQS